MTCVKGDTYRAQIQVADGEEFEIGFRLPINEDDAVRALASVPGANRIYAQRAVASESVDPIRRMGGVLFSSLFEGRSRSLYSRAKEQADADGKGLRIQIVTEEAGLIAMPWEFLHDGLDFIGLSVSSPIVRRPPAVPVKPFAPAPTARLLMIATSAGDLDAGPLLADMKELAQSFPQVAITTVHDVSARQMADALRDDAYDILYLVGARAADTGDAQSLLLAGAGDKREDYQAVSARVLQSILARQNVRLVFLCAQQSDILARDLAAVVPSVIGIRGDIDAASARHFARGLLPSVLAGAAIEAAVTRGRQQVDIENPGSREWGLPVVYTQTSPGTPLIARRREAATANGSDKAAASRQRLTPQQAQRQMLDTRLTILMMNLEAIEKQRTASAGASSSYFDKQKGQLEREIAEVKGKLNHMT
jgi:hypothetical protein